MSLRAVLSQATKSEKTPQPPRGLRCREIFDLLGHVKLMFRRFDLQLAHRWMISSGVGPGGGGGTNTFKIALVEVRDDDGVLGLGEAAPSSRYEENVDSTIAFLEQVDAKRLSFDDVPGSMRYLDTISDE